MSHRLSIIALVLGSSLFLGCQSDGSADESGQPEPVVPTASDDGAENGSAVKYLVSDAPPQAPKSLASALKASWLVVSGQLTKVSKPEEVVSGPYSAEGQAIYYRYSLTRATFAPDGLVDDSIVDVLKSLDSNPSEYPFVTTGAEIADVGFLYGPYDTADESGNPHKQLKLSPMTTQILQDVPGAMKDGGKVVLFLRPDQRPGIGVFYSVVQVVPFDGKYLDASGLSDGKPMSLPDFVELAGDIYSQLESQYMNTAQKQIDEGSSGGEPAGE